ncbi:MAG TPA: hypothetical protein EYP57_09165 [Thermodesulfobacteriaceae bacterium]|nr:hypothetical protein [Thermodesulfobacteriaceae bacterium]
MAGGIRAWDGLKATGLEKLGLELLMGDEDFKNALSLAYSMEDGLRQLYLALADDAEQASVAELLRKLAAFEQGHMAKIRKTTGAGLSEEDDFSMRNSQGKGKAVEGGFQISDIYPRLGSQLTTPEDCLQFAMTLEAQAQDLYQRMARKSTGDETRKVFLDLSRDEEQHLRILADELAELSGQM